MVEFALTSQLSNFCQPSGFYSLPDNITQDIFSELISNDPLFYFSIHVALFVGGQLRQGLLLLSSDRGCGRRPSKKYGGPRTQGSILATTE